MLQTLVCAQLGARFPPGLLPCKLLVSPQHWGLFSCYFFPLCSFSPGSCRVFAVFMGDGHSPSAAVRGVPLGVG